MTAETAAVPSQGRHVRANGIDIHYVEAGEGEPLLLLHGGLVSTSPLWAGAPVAYAAHMDALAAHFRVIAPDTRGCARTTHTGGSVSFALLADDVAALIAALGLERPLIAGFSEGAITATILGIRAPESVRAIVNHAGHDFFNPHAPSFHIMRQLFGGSADATRADPDAVERFFAQSPMRALFELMKTDQDAAQGPEYWRTYLELAFDRTTQWPGYAFDDLGKITAPTLILTGDRDDFCSVEEAAIAYRALQDGELAILPNTGHLITPAAITATIEFLERRLAV
jgi:pimeloyl-ACP methyl ester carboxylesterase